MTVYLVPLIQLVICALVFALVRLPGLRAIIGGFSPFVLSFGILWLLLAIIDIALTIGWPAPPSLAHYAIVASAVYAHGYLIAALVLVYTFARPDSGSFYAGALTSAHILGLAWTEFFRTAIMTVD